MEHHAGKCIGGPLDGQMLDHWSKTKQFLRPMVGFQMGGDPPVIPVTIGEYRINYFGQWHWWPTEEGKAMGHAAGPPRS